MVSVPPDTRCPAIAVPAITPCPRGELTPLIQWLAAGQHTKKALAFPRGTALPDGRLDLCKQSMGPAGAIDVIRAACSSRHVRHLLLGTNAIGNAGASELAEQVERGASELETLYLGCNGIEAAGASRLCQAVANSTRVRALWFKRNPVGGAVSSLSELIESSANLRVLDLFNTMLGDDGGAQIAEALARNTALEHLYLCGNGLGRQTALSLARSLAANTTLRSLFIATNRLADAGVSILADGLAANVGLEHLCLASNDIGPVGAAAVAQALGDHPTLRYLDLGYSRATRALDERANRLGDDGARIIAPVLGRPITTLDLRGNRLTSAGGHALWLRMPRHGVAQVRLGGHVAKRLRERIRDQLTGASHQVPQHVLAIRSVYRSL